VKATLYRKKYLWSPHWRTLRQVVLATANFRCQSCSRRGYGRGAVRLDVHHLLYDRLGHEKLSDLIVLCRLCHNAFHRNQLFPQWPRRH